MHKGKDSEENFALTHESCNKTKQDADLKIARILFRLSKIQKRALDKENKSGSLKHVLENYNGSKFEFFYNVLEKYLEYSFPELRDNSIQRTEIYTDHLSGKKLFYYGAYRIYLS